MFRLLTLSLLLAVTGLQADEPAVIARKAASGIVSALAISGDQLYAVGERGDFFLWDKGLQQQPFPSNQTLTSLVSVGSRLYAVGYNNSIFMRDGSNWKKLSQADLVDSALFSVNFSDDKHGLAVGMFGVALGTQDGLHWDPIELGVEDANLYQVKKDNVGNLYVAGEFGNLVKLSPDLTVLKHIGKTEEPGSTYFGLELIKEDEFLAYGMTGKLVHFTGDKQEVVPTPRKYSLFASVKVKDDIIFVGAQGTILLYRNGTLIDKSTLDKRVIIDAAVYHDQLILGTVSGIREIPLSQVLQ